MSFKKPSLLTTSCCFPPILAVVPRDVSLQTRLTKSITLNIPLLSAAMDTVTEAGLAIAIAQEGGLGIVHKNMSPRAQAAQVAKVKRFESGVVKDPITVPPTMSVREVLALTRQHRISGLPVVDGRKVVGIVTNRDLRFETNLDQPVANIMTKGDRLVTVPEGTELEHAKGLMHQHRLERVLVVNDDFELKGLITVKDILKSTEHPNACKDELGQLARRRGRRHGRPTPMNAWRRWSPPASMWWSSTPRMGIRRACSSGCARSNANTPRCR